MRLHRALFVKPFCRGRGLEIGAMHHPIELPSDARVRYVDRLPVEELRRQYPELDGQPMVHVDVVDNAETLASIPDASEDFVVSAQCIEHCENPIRAIVNMLRVVRDGAFVIMTVPDKRFSFDEGRPLTSPEHLLDECMRGTNANRRGHYAEWVAYVEKKTGPAEAEKRIDELMAQQYAIHFHVWDSESFLAFLLFVKAKLKIPFEIWAAERNGTEFMVCLRKTL